MSKKNWYKVSVLDGSESPYNFHGSSDKTLEEIVSVIEAGKFLRLDDLVYYERGSYKSWSEWDKNVQPTVMLNAKQIISIMQYNSNPCGK